MKQQLITMLELQDAMNSKVNADWREQGFEWYRAIWTESAELMEHYGWKWWKKQQPDTEQVKLELVDIWHFGLSILLLSGSASDSLAEKIINCFNKNHQDIDFKKDIEGFTLQTLKTEGFDCEGFARLLQGIGMSFDELYVQYVGKNVLNFFRQDFGYQDGTYRKQWQGREDNEHLVELVASLDQQSSSFKDDLYLALKDRYTALSAS